LRGEKKKIFIETEVKLDGESSYQGGGRKKKETYQKKKGRTVRITKDQKKISRGCHFLEKKEEFHVSNEGQKKARKKRVSNSRVGARKETQYLNRKTGGERKKKLGW